MDLNKLLHHHQRALILRCGAASSDARRSAGASAAFYAERIAQARSALGREDPFTWSRAQDAGHGGSLCCG